VSNVRYPRLDIQVAAWPEGKDLVASPAGEKKVKGGSEWRRNL
jgi:hypothetical protein